MHTCYGTRQGFCTKATAHLHNSCYWNQYGVVGVEHSRRHSSSSPSNHTAHVLLMAAITCNGSIGTAIGCFVLDVTISNSCGTVQLCTVYTEQYTQAILYHHKN